MKRKLIALVVSVLLCLTALSPVAMAANQTSVIDLPSNYSGLNVRSGPGTNYAVSGWVIEGDEVELLSVGSTWTKITVLRSGKQGYIKNAYIRDIGSSGGSSGGNTGSVNPSKGGTATAARVSHGGVNLRKGPSTSYASVGTLSTGTKLKVWTSDGNWNYVTTLTGKTGWVSKSYVSTGYTTTTSAGVNLRESANGGVIKTLAKGTSVTVQSITGSWSKVKVGATTGYVYNTYLN